MPKFAVMFNGSISIEIDEVVLNRAGDSSMPYGPMDRKEIVEHLAYNALFNHANLTSLDGWADLQDNLMKLVDWDAEVEYDREIKDE